MTSKFLDLQLAARDNSIMRNKSAILLICVLCLGVAEAPKPDLPRSVPARGAIQDYEKSMHDAQDAYREAQISTERKLIDKLNAAMNAATKAADLPEANRIDAQVKMATARVEALRSPAAPAPVVADIKIVGKWTVGSNPIVYTPDGLVEARKDWGNERGKWRVVDPYTVIQYEPNGGVVTITITASGRYAFWEYKNGHTAWASRSDDR
jgi:hypothetical protein